MGFFENRSGVYGLVHEHRTLEKSAICGPLEMGSAEQDRNKKEERP
jgi:hypothetical protein